MDRKVYTPLLLAGSTVERLAPSPVQISLASPSILSTAVLASALGAGFGTLLRLRQLNILGHTIESPLTFLGGEESFPPRGNWPVAEDTFLDVDSPTYAPASSKNPDSPKAYTAPQEFIPAEIPDTYDEIYLDGEPFDPEIPSSRTPASPISPGLDNREAQEAVDRNPSATALDQRDSLPRQETPPRPSNRTGSREGMPKPITPIVPPPPAVPPAPPVATPPAPAQPLETPKETTRSDVLRSPDLEG